MMTLAQGEAIAHIGKSLNPPSKVKQHPSKVFRESFDAYTDTDILNTVKALRVIYAKNDGWLAHRVIATDKKEGLAGVVGLYLSGQLNG